MHIYSLFQSIDGEVNARGQGCLSTFLRLSMCNCNCRYCDVPEAREEYDEASIDDLTQWIVELGCPNITITGGEPLLQAEDLLILIHRISARMRRAHFSIETNGTLEPFKVIPPLENVSFVVDYKLPGAGTKLPLRNLEAIYGKLRHTDWIKFVITNAEDYRTAKDAVQGFCGGLANSPRLAFSPVMGPNAVMTPKVLMKNMIRDGLWDIILNCQIHKLINVE